MDLEFINANTGLPNDYSPSRPSSLEAQKQGPDGRAYRFIGIYEKNFSPREQGWFFIYTFAKTLFSLGLALFSETVRNDWKALWRGKKVVAIYQSPITPIAVQTLSSPEESTTPPATILNSIQTLVTAYRKGEMITTDSYKNQFSKIMSQLGYENGGLDEQGNPIAEEFKPLFDKIAARLGAQGVTCREAWSNNRAEDLANEHVAAFVYHNGGHFSTWICQKNDQDQEEFHSCPEYLLLEEGFIQTNEGLEPLNKQDFIAQYGQYPGYVIYSNQKNGSTTYPGKLPNINSCAFDSAIHVLAKILP